MPGGVCFAKVDLPVFGFASECAISGRLRQRREK